MHLNPDWNKLAKEVIEMLSDKPSAAEIAREWRCSAEYKIRDREGDITSLTAILDAYAAEQVQARDRQWCIELAKHGIAARASYLGEIQLEREQERK